MKQREWQECRETVSFSFQHSLIRLLYWLWINDYFFSLWSLLLSLLSLIDSKISLNNWFRFRLYGYGRKLAISFGLVSVTAVTKNNGICRSVFGCGELLSFNKAAVRAVDSCAVGCEYGNKADWCETIRPLDCYMYYNTCCETCRVHFTGIDGSIALDRAYYTV